MKVHKKIMRDSIDFMKGGVILGVGSQAVGSVGGSAASNVQAGLGKVSKSYSTLGSIMSAGYVMEGLQGLKKQAKKIKK